MNICALTQNTPCTRPVKTLVVAAFILNITTVALAILSISHAQYKIHMYIGFGGTAICYSGALGLFIYNYRNKRGLAASQTGANTTYIAKAVVKGCAAHADNKHELCVYLSKNLIEQLFPKKQKKQHIQIGNSVYRVLENKALSDNTLSLTDYQKKQLEKDLNEEITAASSIQIASIDSETIPIAAKVKLTISIRDVKNPNEIFLRDEFSNNFIFNLYGGESFKNNQEVSICVEERIYDLKFSSSSEYFTFSKEQSSFSCIIDGNCLDSTPTTENVTLSFVGHKTVSDLSTKLTGHKKTFPQIDDKNLLHVVDSSHFWKAGEVVKVKEGNEDVLLVLESIKEKNTKISIAKQGAQIFCTFETVEEFYATLNKAVQGLLDKKKTILEKLKSDSEGQVDDKHLTIVERLENRGVVGLPLELNEPFQRIMDYRDPEKWKKYVEWGKTLPKGILLYGPPGMGKSSLVNQMLKIIGFSEAEIRIVKKGELIDCQVGQTEKNIHALFALPPNTAFRVVVIDEIESLFGDRSKLDRNYEKSHLNTFLEEMSSESNSNVIVIGMTNRINDMDEAFLRPGRFTNQILIDLPNEQGREKIFAYYINQRLKKGQSEEIDISKLLKDTEGMNGDQIRHIVDLASDRAFDESTAEKTVKMTTDDLIQAIKKVKKTSH